MDKKKPRKSKKELPKPPEKLGEQRALLRQYASQLEECKTVLEKYSSQLKERGKELKQIMEKGEERSPLFVLNQKTMTEVDRSDNSENSQVEIVDVEFYPVDENLLWGFHIDFPQKGDKINGYVLEIVGWMLGRKAPAVALEILESQRIIREVAIHKPRLGVAQYYPQLPKAKTCGFATEVGLIGLPKEAKIIIQGVLKDRTRVPIGEINLRYKPQKSMGIIYIATGERFIREACNSAATLKAQMPNMPITIFASEEVKSPHIDKVVIVKKPQYNFFDKIINMYASPYDYTFFIDTDTYICADFSEIFAILDRFDLAAAHAPMKIPGYVKGVPESFQQMNTGAILFKKSPVVEKLFEKWLKLYQEVTDKGSQENDQPTFREALYQSDLRVATLTAEYNCRFPFPVLVNRTVKILHGRHPDLPAVSKKINSNKNLRVFQPKNFQL